MLEVFLVWGLSLDKSFTESLTEKLGGPASCRDHGKRHVGLLHISEEGVCCYHLFKLVLQKGNNHLLLNYFLK